MISDDYNEARRSGIRAMREAQAEGRYPYLPALDDILGPEGAGLSQVNLHLHEIPISMVVGTKTKGRQNSFADNFMPIMENGTEFSSKWENVLQYQMDTGINDPIKCYEYLKKFYVQEGNKRVSVLKYLKVPTVDAEVIRIMPTRNGDPKIEAYYEFVDFYKVCPLYEIEFTKPGSYRRMVQLLGLSMEEPWPSEAVRMVEASYFRFVSIFESLKDLPVSGLTAGDAYLVYISFYTAGSLIDQPKSVLENRIERMSDEFRSIMSDDNIDLLKTPVEREEKQDQGFFAFLFQKPQTYTESNPLRVSFIYNMTPEESSWISDMDIGRVYLEKCFNGRVKTTAYAGNSTDEEVAKAITKAAEEDKAEVIITTNPAMMPRTARAAIDYKNIRFLNMSLNLSHPSVRSYYARMYEAKFLLGALAALHSEDHRIGYLADQPIYGNIANINAFAIGAALIDPKVKIILEWSSLRDHDWRQSFKDQGIKIICGPEYAWFSTDPSEHGVYRVNDDGSTDNIASSQFNWGRYYEIIIRSILNGSYDDDLSADDAKAINYWYGYSAGVIEVHTSERISYYSRKIVGILRKGIISGEIQPFAGEINSQNRQIQPQGAATLDDESIILMDWLNDNVIGSIPAKADMSERAQKMVSVSGVLEELRQAEKVEN